MPPCNEKIQQNQKRNVPMSDCHSLILLRPIKDIGCKTAVPQGPHRPLHFHGNRDQSRRLSRYRHCCHSQQWSEDSLTPPPPHTVPNLVHCCHPSSSVWDRVCLFIEIIRLNYYIIVLKIYWNWNLTVWKYA